MVGQLQVQKMILYPSKSYLSPAASDSVALNMTYKCTHTAHKETDDDQVQPLQRDMSHSTSPACEWLLHGYYSRLTSLAGLVM